MWGNALFLRRLGTLLLLIAFGLAIYAGWKILISAPVFNFKHIIVTGQVEHVTRSQVAAAVKTSISSNFFGQKLENIQNSFQKLPWIHSVSVRRVWPDTIYVDVVEHVVYARWGESGLMNQYGELFDGATDADLPVLYGPPGSEREVKKRFEEFNKALTRVNVRIRQLELSPRYAWTLTLTTGEKVRLGREERPGVVQNRLAHFAAVYPRLATRYGRKLDTVDMRYPNGFTVKVKSAANESARTVTTTRNEVKVVERESG